MCFGFEHASIVLKYQQTHSACGTGTPLPVTAVKPASKPAAVRKHDVLRPVLPSPRYEAPIQPPILAAQSKQQAPPVATVHTQRNVEPVPRASTTSRPAPAVQYSVPPPAAITTVNTHVTENVPEMLEPESSESRSSIQSEKPAPIESYSHMDGANPPLQL